MNRTLNSDRECLKVVDTFRTGLLEDAGCSSELDRHLWKEEPSKRCEFTVKVQEACSAQ